MSYELHHGPIGAGLFVDMVSKGRALTGDRNCNARPEVIEFKRARAKARYKGLRKARLTAGSIGQLNPRAILTEQAVRDIRAKVAAGMSHGAAAYEYAVSPSTVRSIVTRRTWKHVD